MQFSVSNTDALIAALKTAQSGDTILLTAGSYSAINLSGVNFAGQGVTIASADPSHPATVAGVGLDRCSGLTFSNLEVTINSSTQDAFDVSYSSNIHLVGINMHGAPGGDVPGLLFKNSSNVSVENSEFHDLGTSAVRNYQSDHVTISNNNFHDINGDGVDSNDSSYVTVHGNYFTNFHEAPGDHPDAIQFYTAGQTTSAHDITVSDNTVVRGTGDVVQGVFMGNEANIPYQNVEITGNKIIGEMYNGIAIGNGQNVEIANNVVEGYTDMTSWIRVEGSSGVSIHDNQTTGILDTNGNTGLSEANNTIISQAAIGDTSILGSSTGSGTSGMSASSSPPTSSASSAPSTAVSGPTLAAPAPDSATSGQVLSGANGHALYGGSGADTITGGAGSNTLSGGDGNDSISGSVDFNRINGNAGDDSIVGHSTVGDWLSGGQGQDSIDASASTGANILNGNLGNDTLVGGSGADTLRGGQGDDVIHAGTGNNWISGDLGNNTIYGGQGMDTFHASAGHDVVNGWHAGDHVQVDSGVPYTVTQVNADVHVGFANGGEMILQNTKLNSLGVGWILQN
jgi:Ca2+-binding RTX toxin-like protein